MKCISWVLAIYQTGQQQDNIRKEGEQEQNANLDQDKRHYRAGDIDKILISYRPGDIETDTQWRGAVTDAQVDGHQQAEMHGIDTESVEQR